MKIDLAYGTTGLTVDLPEARTTVVRPRPQRAHRDPMGALLGALRRPIGSAPLRDLATGRPNARVAISVCDLTRAQPRQLMLRAIFEVLEGAVRPENVTILIATGTHRSNTPTELESMLGGDILSRYRVINHVARDRSTLVDLGIMGNGVPVALNREWMAADLRITTGFVEPHFFAGFSGGPKMVAPGLAGIETVLTLHDARRIGHPKATWGVTEGNPVHDDVRAIAAATGVSFALDVTLNSGQEITSAFGGELFAMHRAACAAAREVAMQPVDRPFDVVITSNSGYPLDQNLYQLVKGMSAAAKVVRKDGLILCAGECRDGVPDHGSYAEILRSRRSLGELLEMIESPGYRVPDQWQVQVQAKVQRHARVMVRADGVTGDQLRAAHLTPARDIQAEAVQALEAAGPGATACVLPEGPQTIPYLKHEQS
ncbi:MAG: nickel-dependent lactate racemase [SAR202 cluster bacterium]|nr:nickel-dependent lactate racemase [SAR202 cluster bacterium]